MWPGYQNKSRSFLEWQAALTFRQHRIRVVAVNTDGDWALEISRLHKVYRRGAVANDGISLRVEPGEVYGLLGPNGAGKSTLVKQVIGLLEPTSGQIRLGPHDLVAVPATARQLCSYLPQAQMPIESLRAAEAIELGGLIRGGGRQRVRARTDDLIEALDLGEWRGTVGARLSGGVRRLVGFAMVAVHPGRVVILDEPTNDVDPLRRRLLWQQVRRLADDGCAVILVTHNVLEAEKAVDRLAIIDQGRLLAEGTPSALKADTRDQLRLQVMLRPDEPEPPRPAFLAQVVRTGNTLIAAIPAAAAADAIAWAQDLVDAGPAEEFALGASTLEDAYIRLTGHAAADGAGALR
jgi:ABC-2 type transport system ATP-binding protein